MKLENIKEQPSIITIRESAISQLRCYGLFCGVEYDTRLQERAVGDRSKIVYIANPIHNPADRNSNQFVALTAIEYDVVKYCSLITPAECNQRLQA